LLRRLLLAVRGQRALDAGAGPAAMRASCVHLQLLLLLLPLLLQLERTCICGCR
jgi:hypothetical protein